MYRYNPFELGIYDPRGLHGDGLTVALAQELAKTHRVGTVKDTVLAGRRGTDGTPMRLLKLDSQDVLSLPADLIADLIADLPGTHPEFSLLAADFVLVQECEDRCAWKIGVVEDGPLACDGVVAYVADEAACPSLASDADFFTVQDVAGLAAHVRGWLAARADEVVVNGLILAGGSSTRMGADKGTLKVGGQTQVARCLETLNPHCAEVFVSVRSGQLGDYSDYACIADRFLDCGPMGGVLSAMAERPETAWVVLACDMPRVSAEVIGALLEARNPLKAATAFDTSDGMPEPLCAVYEPKARRYLHAGLARGQESLRRFLMTGEVCRTAAPGGDVLVRVNTREEFDQA